MEDASSTRALVRVLRRWQERGASELRRRENIHFVPRVSVGAQARRVMRRADGCGAALRGPAGARRRRTTATAARIFICIVQRVPAPAPVGKMR
jgi:hypothetical protein